MYADFKNADGKDDDAGMALKLVCLELLAFCVASGLVYFTKNFGVGVLAFLVILLGPFAYAVLRDVRKDKALHRNSQSPAQG